ncbi:squalene epoxidase-domain-containing protein [Suillus subluteus]|nr:squalene epoxidase-domain-containing protein [Suillus subluteus]
MPLYNILIMGASVAGPALAHALATKTYEKHDVPLQIALLECSLLKPDRIIAKFLQPGGVTALKKLGLESCLRELGSISLSGYHVLRGGQSICSSFPEGHVVQTFDHGAFIMALCDHARQASNIDVIETTVTSLIKNKDTHRVIGVLASKVGGQPESYFADLVILADSSSSKFRTAVLRNMQYEPLQGGYFAGLIVKDLKLLMSKYAIMAVLKGAGPVIIFELPNNTHQVLIKLKQPPSDIKEHIIHDIIPQLPSLARAPILNALETSHQGRSSKSGTFLLGDSLNVCHPLTAGGMTIALNDVVILSDLLAHIENFGDWDEISAMRKSLAHTINVMSMCWAGMFAAEGEAFDIMQEGAFKYFGKGAKYAEEPISLAAGITHSPLLLARNSLAIVTYSIWVLFTHPRPGNKSAPQFYKYPLLFIKALNVIWTIGMVMGPVMWAEM